MLSDPTLDKLPSKFLMLEICFSSLDSVDLVTIRFSDFSKFSAVRGERASFAAVDSECPIHEHGHGRIS